MKSSFIVSDRLVQKQENAGEKDEEILKRLDSDLSLDLEKLVQNENQKTAKHTLKEETKRL